jgi:hypothetical protein
MHTMLFVVVGVQCYGGDSVIYVDPLFDALPRTAQARRHGTQWCHMVCDGDIEELHQFAESIGMHRFWFKRKPGGTPHYDLTPGKRALAVRKGAIELDWRAFQEKLKQIREARQ